MLFNDPNWHIELNGGKITGTLTESGRLNLSKIASDLGKKIVETEEAIVIKDIDCVALAKLKKQVDAEIKRRKELDK